jgi:hypothetical protein
MDQFYKIRISIGRISLELESHDKEWLEAKQESLLGSLLNNPEGFRQLISEPSVSTGSGENPQSHRLLPEESMSINEFYTKFLKGKSMGRNEVAVYMIYFLERIRKVADIASSTVKDAFAELQYPKYQEFNFADILNQAKRKGYLNRVDDKWKLTLTGSDFVLSQIADEK